MHFQRLIPTCFLILFAVISITLPASAREKTDLVILKNGDHITCEIQTLARGMLTIKTDSMSTVQIKWPDVEKIESPLMFTVEDTQGQIYVGSLQPADDGHRLNVVGSRGAKNLPHISIVEIRELEGSRWRRLSGSADLGFSFSKASDRKQFNFAGDVTYRAERYSSKLSYSATLGTSKGETDADRSLVTLAGTRQLSGKWLAYSQFSYEHNLELQLDNRFSFLGGPGYRIVQSNRSLVTAIGAVNYTREAYYGEDTKKSAEGFLGIDAQFFKLYSPKIDIASQFGYLPSFTTSGRNRIQFNTNLRIEVLKNFFFNLTFYDSYDSKPPSETATKNDYGLTTGLSWTFRR